MESKTLAILKNDCAWEFLADELSKHCVVTQARQPDT